jgi:hypothetical protein
MMADDDKVNAQFAFAADDSDDLLIWFDKPMKEMRLSRVDADCLYTLLNARFGKPLVSHPPRPHYFFIAHGRNDKGMSSVLDWWKPSPGFRYKAAKV